MALRFAQALECQSPPAVGEVCGRCRACRQLPGQTYPDLHVVESGEGGPSLKVEQIRELQRHLSLSPLEGRWRIALLLRFHEATAGAANALLKTLEEPPAPVVLLVTARSAEALLPTVVSRCEVVPLRPLAHADLAHMLEERGLAGEEARLIAGLAGGRPGRALQLVQDRSLLDRRGEILNDLRTVLQAGRAERFAYAETLAKDRAAAVQALETWQSMLRDVLMVSVGAEAERINPDREDEVERLAAAKGTETWVGAVEAVERTLAAVHGNANLRLALEVLSLDLPRLP
jgi:DNA polymerase III subunit delta'